MAKCRVLAAVLAGIILLVLACVFTWLFHVYDNFRSTLQFGAAVLGGAGVIFSAFYGFLMAADLSAEKRRRRSLEIIDQFNKREFVQLWAQLEEYLKAPNGAKTIIEDRIKRADANFFIGLIEDIALTIRTHVADEQVLYDSLSLALPNTFKNCEEFIKKMRQRHNDNTVFEEFAELVSCWQKGVSYRSNKKLKRVIIPKPPTEVERMNNS